MDPGPLEYVVIEFDSDRVDGAIAPAVAALVARGVVRVVDLVFVKKDASGQITPFEYDELDEAEAFAAIDGDADGLLSDEDVEILAAGLGRERAAVIILFEDLWAAELAQAVRGAGAAVVGGGRVADAAATDALAAVGAAPTTGGPS